jgi:hypothetical protein
LTIQLGIETANALFQKYRGSHLTEVATISGEIRGQCYLQYAKGTAVDSEQYIHGHSIPGAGETK